MNRKQTLLTAGFGTLTAIAAHAGIFEFDLDVISSLPLAGDTLGLFGIHTTMDYELNTLAGGVEIYNSGEGSSVSLEPLYSSLSLELTGSFGTTTAVINPVLAPNEGEGRAFVTLYNADGDMTGAVYDASFMGFESQYLMAEIEGVMVGISIFLYAEIPDLVGSTIPAYEEWPMVDNAPGVLSTGSLTSNLLWFYPLAADLTGNPNLSADTIEILDFDGTISHSSAIPEPSALIGVPLLFGIVALRRRRR